MSKVVKTDDAFA